MFRNYLKTAVRNLLRYKGFALINISSLTIGFIGCLAIALFVWDELQFDKSIPGGDQVYRIYNERQRPSGITHDAPVAPAYASFLEQTYPEVDTAARILMLSDRFLVERGETKAYEDKGIYTEGSFFKVFPLAFAKGNPASALNAPNSIVLTPAIAQRYFGSEDPMGKTLKIEKEDFHVTGVLAPLPDHFHLDFNYLMSLSSAGIPKERMEKWTWTQFYTYVRLKPGTDVAQLQSKFQAYIKKDIYPTLTESGNTFLPIFQPLSKIHLQSADFVYDNAIRGNETYVKGLTIIAVFVLLIACFNFINLSTARSFRRAKEIGVRKVVGADRRQLIFQFMFETALLALFAALLCILSMLLIIPAMDQFTGKSIPLSLLAHPLLLLGFFGGAVLIGILAGVYPALVLSAFQPIKVLKRMKLTGTGSRSGWLRQALVVVQFALSALLIISSTIVYRQIRFLNDKDLGFDKEQVLTFEVKGEIEKNLGAFKEEIRQAPGVRSVTSGYGLPGDRFAGDNVSVPGPEGDKEHSVSLFIGDYDYVKTLGLHLIKGRDFSREMKTDKDEAFVINETAVTELGFGTPDKAIGQRINWPKWNADSLNPVKKGKVIGVVQDFHYKSLHEKVAASVIQIEDSITYKVAVKLNTADVKSTLAFIERTWKKFAPAYPLDYSFMDESYGAMYQSEQKLGSLLFVFTIMAIVVGCMGLFALAAFSAEQRTKEIGIRKVMGATVVQIMALLSGSFVRLVLLASLIAFPVGWWAMHSWLKDFPYRVTISWWVFGVAAIAAVGIAVITVSFQSVKAATTNPVKSLRSE